MLMCVCVKETYSSAAGAEKLQALKKDLDSVKDNVHQNISTCTTT